MSRPPVLIAHPRGIKRKRRYRTCRDQRELHRHDVIHTIVQRHTIGMRIYCGHYGALYWAICASFGYDGRPIEEPTFGEYALRWRCEATGGGSRPWRKHHGVLWDWAVAIAVREWQSARDKARKEVIQKSAA